MQVRRSDAPVRREHEHTDYFFCSDKCAHKFDGEPAKYASGQAASGMDEPVAGSVTDPVCGMTVNSATAAAHADYAGRDYAFCSTGCHDRFVAEPLAHLETARDPVCGMEVEVARPGARTTVGGTDYVFCMQGCADAYASRGQVLDVSSSGVPIADAHGPVEHPAASR